MRKFAKKYTKGRNELGKRVCWKKASNQETMQARNVCKELGKKCAKNQQVNKQHSKKEKQGVTWQESTQEM